MINIISEHIAGCYWKFKLLINNKEIYEWETVSIKNNIMDEKQIENEKLWAIKKTYNDKRRKEEIRDILASYLILEKLKGG